MIKPQAQPMRNAEAPIGRVPVTEDDQRSAVFVKHFKNNFLLAEQLVFVWMDRLCKEYNGGYWHIYELSNGGFYMAPETDARFETLCPGFGTSVLLSADAAGLVASLFAVCQLANQTRDDHVIELYHLLRDYVFEHQEAGNIFRAID